jgi:ELWxxDGT repeat protein
MLCFTATAPGIGQELEERWTTPGTLVGYQPGRRELVPFGLVNLDGTVYFGRRDDFRSSWKSDGTVAGTVLVRDINLVRSSSPVRDMNGTLYSRHRALLGAEPIDGTAAGTVVVDDIIGPRVDAALPTNSMDALFLGE